jgi:hypothetical protein
MYEALERLAPGANEFVEWIDLSCWQRDLYCNAIERLLVERDVILEALNLSDDNMVLRSFVKRE